MEIAFYPEGIILLTAIFIILFFVAILRKTKKFLSPETRILNVISILLIIIEGLPLLIYPFVLIANLMSLAGLGASDQPFMANLLMVLFLIATSTYPLTYIFSAFFVFKRESRYKLLVALCPVLHILLAYFLFQLGD